MDTKNEENNQKPGENSQEKIELSPKRERFCQEYIKDHNGTKAAERAGYSKRTANEQAAMLLAILSVKKRVEQLDRAIAEKLQIDTEWVVQRSKEVVQRCMQAEPVMVFDPSEKQMVHAIDSETGQGIYQFDSRGANGALALLSKYTGGFTDRFDHTTKGKEINPEININPDSMSESERNALRSLIRKTSCPTQQKA